MQVIQFIFNAKVKLIPAFYLLGSLITSCGLPQLGPQYILALYRRRSKLRWDNIVVHTRYINLYAAQLMP